LRYSERAEGSLHTDHEPAVQGLFVDAVALALSAEFRGGVGVLCERDERVRANPDTVRHDEVVTTLHVEELEAAHADVRILDADVCPLITDAGAEPDTVGGDGFEVVLGLQTESQDAGGAIHVVASFQ